jgi:VWFA-related protein
MRLIAAALMAALAGLQRPVPVPFTPDTTVRIDASVSDARGRFIDALSVKDFELTEDGVHQAIEAVRVLRADAAGDADVDRNAAGAEPDEQAQAGRPGARLFALYLDEYHVSAAGAERARPALTEFVDTLGPRDLLVVMKPLDSILTIHLSRDRDTARETIAAFAGRKGDYEPRNQYERSYMASTPAAIDQARMQVTLSALEALAVHLGWAASDARKTLIVVTDELSRGMRRRGLSLPTIDSIARAANRFNVAVYPIGTGDEGAAAKAGPAGLPEALTTLASETDGYALSTSTDLASGLRRIQSDTSAYYLITYHSPKMIDGRFHEIQLKVKRTGARVRTRKGYWAASADELMRAELAARDAMPKKPTIPEPPRHLSPLIRPWFGLARGDDGKTRVTFVWEPVHSLGDRNRRVAARVELTALGNDDATVFQGTVMPTGAGAVDEDAVPLRAVFEVPPGSVRLRMSIEDSASRVIDSDVREISVRDLAGPVVLGTPEVLRARNAREFRALANDPLAAPVAAREFSRTERLLIRVRAYAASGQPASVTARLLSRLGQEMRELKVALPAVGPPQIDLPLASLAPGDYIIEVTATTPTGEAKDLMTFRVTS